MDDVRAIALARQQERFKILELLYQDGFSGARRMSSGAEVAQRLGMAAHVAEEHFGYLKRKGLIITNIGGMIALTPAGQDEIEAAVSRPDRPTEHFPANIYNVTINAGGNVAGVQVASAGATQHATAGQVAAPDLAGVVAALRAAAADTAIADGDRRLIEVTAEQLEASGENPSKIRGLLDTAKATLDAWTSSSAAATAAQALGALAGGTPFGP